MRNFSSPSFGLACVLVAAMPSASAVTGGASAMPVTPAAGASAAGAVWGVAPKGWDDFRIALADNNTKMDVIQAGMKSANIYGRYRYLNNGADPASNWYSYTGPGGLTLTNFDKASKGLGIKSSFVIYMLQEDGGYPAFTANVNNATFMKNFFWSLEWAVKAMKDQGTVYVIEPDTWGYLLQEEHTRGVNVTADFGKQIAKESAQVNTLGYAYLADLPNTVSGLMRGILRCFRVNAPDAIVGFHANTWAWYPATGGDVNGMVYWKQTDVDTYADIVGSFFNNVIGDADKGDFLAVEKYGLDAGVGGQKYYWNDAQMAKWIGWSKRVAQKMNVPLLGWQIPIGHMGLPNTLNRYEDTFMAYFFAHPKDFVDAGFIGLWVGKGLEQGTDYSVTVGQGDDGWLFQNLHTFDAQRPYLTTTAVRPRAAQARTRRSSVRFDGAQLAFASTSSQSRSALGRLRTTGRFRMPDRLQSTGGATEASVSSFTSVKGLSAW